MAKCKVCGKDTTSKTFQLADKARSVSVEICFNCGKVESTVMETGT